ncbi:urease accessory protein UreD [Rhizobiaceae bacterium BDR2-2]|uniref:Urease accessory protein UreD n=1 Tax=Ectorhizobium quercum TaxID=2965071 RepID=A0AAE3MYL0_9HYPH|nr:urease accessory protein UreD [Ectorhizobium quercum]MCX8996691.1 urease accessory protein UreD [Ectorhizobium quercum]
MVNDAADIRPQRARGTGRLTARFSAGRARVGELYQEGCGKIRLPETFSVEMEAILINSSGGLTGGDRLDWTIRAEEQTFLTVTTQACEKIYKAADGVAEIATHIVVGEGARVHWLPQETILFDNAALARRLDVDLGETSEFIGLEASLLGRKAMGEAMSAGLFRDRWRVRRSGRLIHAEELKLDGDIAQLTSLVPVLGGEVAFATLLYCGGDAEAFLPKVRDILGEAIGGASFWQDKLVVRFAAVDGFALRKILIPMLSVLRKGAPVPKVWNL